jgi:hypothetical protein
VRKPPGDEAQSRSLARSGCANDEENHGTRQATCPRRSCAAVGRADWYSRVSGPL